MTTGKKETMNFIATLQYRPECNLSGHNWIWGIESERGVHSSSTVRKEDAISYILAYIRAELAT